MRFQNDQFKRGFNNPVGRWAALGPYYAMFPLEFAFEVVRKYSKPNQFVIDPFAGRASSIYAAATQGRHGLGIEINPVGWVYAQAKLNPAPLFRVENRLNFIVKLADDYLDKATEMPEFFQVCYSRQVLAFLLAARDILNWRKKPMDTTLMAFILVYLHGKLGEGLSNQMRQTKAMGPDYSVQWWQERNLEPPEIDCYQFLLQRIRWRYAKGIPATKKSEVQLGDSTDILQDIVELYQNGLQKPYSLLFTSPPYHKVTNYYADQWLRLWMLGGSERFSCIGEKHKGKFYSKETYRQLLDSVFQNVSQMMAKNSVVYVRTDARKFTFDTTLEILRKYFPSRKEDIIPKPQNKTQTSLFGDKSKKPGEVDIILT